MAREASPEKTRMPWKRMEVVRLLFGGFAVAVVVIALASAQYGPEATQLRVKRAPTNKTQAPIAAGTNQANFKGNRTGIMWGPWIQYYSEVWDGPGIYAARVQADPSVFHYNVEIAAALLPDPLPFLQGVIATGTDAAFYLTVYPFKGWDVVTDAAIKQLVDFCSTVIKSGRKMVVRFAPEMNGTWFAYGQHPSYFKMMWMAIWNAIKADPVAKETNMMWAVNSIQGYPFCGGSEYCGQGKPWESEMDTNAPEGLDGEDDPYMPYYPGDDYVDSVGMSIYHYGIQYPWLENVVPYSTKFVDMVRGRNDQGTRDFYKMFCEPPRNKMFAVAESAVATHVQLDQGEGEAKIKTAWWKQIWDAKDEFPNMFLITFFEHIKHEEATFRDFISASIYKADVNRAFQKSIHSNPDLIFANRLGPEEPYIVFGRWPNMTTHTLQTGEYPAYDPVAFGGNTTVLSKTTLKTTTLFTTTVARTTTLAPLSTSVAAAQPSATGTLTRVTPTTTVSGAGSLRIGGSLMALLAALAMLLL